MTLHAVAEWPSRVGVTSLCGRRVMRAPYIGIGGPEDPTLGVARAVFQPELERPWERNFRPKQVPNETPNIE